MARLLACPFCRERFEVGKATICPSCDLPLLELGDEPPVEEADFPLDSPLEVRRGWGFLGRGRGLGLLLAPLGLALFFAPWMTLARPDPISLSGFDLARGNVGYLWGGAVGWFLTIPILASRQSILELRGARVIVSTFAAMTTIECLLLGLRPPRDYTYFQALPETAWGLHASFVVSLVMLVLGLRLGGKLTDLRDLPERRLLRRPSDSLH